MVELRSRDTGREWPQHISRIYGAVFRLRSRDTVRNWLHRNAGKNCSVDAGIGGAGENFSAGIIFVVLIWVPVLVVRMKNEGGSYGRTCGVGRCEKMCGPDLRIRGARI